MKYRAYPIAFWSVLFVLMATTGLKAQNGWNWPEDKSTAQEKVVLYTDAKKQKDYAAAVQPITWLHENAPDLNPSIYIDGADIYEELALKESDEAKKKEYVENALEMYDLRLKYFGGNGKDGDILNRKANAAYKLLYKDASEYDRLMSIFQETMDKSNDVLVYYNVTPFMAVIKTQYEKGKINDEQVLEMYERLSQMIEKQSASGKYAAKYVEAGEKMDSIFAGFFTMSCDQISQKLVPKLQQNPDDVDLAKRIISLSLSSSCTDQDFFMTAAETLFDNGEEDPGLAKALGTRAMASEDYEKAKEWYQKALEISSNDQQKADITMDLGTIALKEGDKSTARKHFLEAAKMDSELSEKAYTQVGNMYMQSYDQCKGGEDVVKDRAVFLAAYEMYRQAGNTASMANAKEQFPSKEEVFTYNKEVGGQVQVGCWIGQSVTIQTRD
uniref:Tetratricopeptide repeat protein n=1 Tax=Roseihalotalea indica TaxID=2867963 RepID=A0AA49GP23_9BACT|nr:hypothetical protein K4G66_03630 [Tunicatimonas sp. TK19036]